MATISVMDIIDAQLHAWLPDSDAYPWDPGKKARSQPADKHVSAEDLLAMMQAVGVSAALLTSPAWYGDNHDYAFDSAARYPGRFGVVAPVSPATPDVTRYVRAFRDRPGGVGIRLPSSNGRSPLDAEYAPILAAAQQGRVPVFLGAPGYLPEVRLLATRHENVLFIIDHLGHPVAPSGPQDLNDLANLLALAACPNVAIKCTDAPRFARDRYPFADIWPGLLEIIRTFGARRVMWGSDITRIRRYSYAEALGYIRYAGQLSGNELEYLLGGAIRDFLGWPG
jgi:L-fuconolactonase